MFCCSVRHGFFSFLFVFVWLGFVCFCLVDLFNLEKSKGATDIITKSRLVLLEFEAALPRNQIIIFHNHSAGGYQHGFNRNLQFKFAPKICFI